VAADEEEVVAARADAAPEAEVPVVVDLEVAAQEGVVLVEVAVVDTGVPAHRRAAQAL